MVKRFWDKVEIDNPHSCWEWRACLTIEGYGWFTNQGTQVLAHRFAYELVRGTIPDGLTIDHLCRNKHCANPFHLEIVSRQENIRRWNDQRVVKTHCSKDHELTEENTYINKKTNQRRCKRCEAINRSRYRRMKRKEIRCNSTNGISQR